MNRQFEVNEAHGFCGAYSYALWVEKLIHKNPLHIHPILACQGETLYVLDCLLLVSYFLGVMLIWLWMIYNI